MDTLILANAVLFLSTLSLRRATNGHDTALKKAWISIHALLAESDKNGPRPSTGIHDFYPRSPCGERRVYCRQGSAKTAYFYPRSPCGERPKRLCNALKHLHFYPRSPCGERPYLPVLFYKKCIISIHALLAESDRL